MTEASSSSASVSRGVWILHVTKCSHLQSEKKTFKTLPGNMPISSAIDIVHPPPGSMVCGRVMCGSGQKPTEWVDVEDTDATLSQLEGFGFNHLKIQCTGDSCEEAGPSTVKSKGATVSAFDVLMSPVKVPPPKKTSSSGQSEGLNRKDELFNDLVSDFTDRGCLFARDQAGSEGSYIIQVLCNSLWYVTNQHVVINDAALRKKSVTAVPVAFDKYQGYNDYKRKKMKAQQMSSTQLNSHAQALYSLCNRPVMKSSAAWVEAHNDIEKLADCLSAYREHLDEMLESQAKRHESDHPVRELENNCSVEHRTSSSEVRMQYRALDKRMQEAEYHEPVLFDEDKHLVAPFENSVQRHRFIASLQLSCPVDLYRYVPGGSLATVLYIVKVEETRSQSELLTQAAKVMATIRPRLPQIHTRQMLRHFKQHLSNIAHIAPSVADLIYKELALDEAAASHPETQQRLKLVFLGETGLMTDMRAVNPGRPGSMADVRRLAQEHPELAEGWRCSIESVQALLLARFSRLALKDKPFQVMDPVSQTEIEELFEMLKALFPDLDVTKLQKQHTKKSSTYTNWLQQHCRQTQYSFQVRKCQDASCCEPPTLGEEQLRWLPEPQLDPSGDHYLPFKEVYPMDTTEVDRPTLVSARSGKRPASVLTVEDEVRQMDANKYTAQNGRAVVECIECRKPRLVYSERKLTERQKTSLACLYSEYEYSCGSVATPPDHLLHSVVFVRTTLTCESRIETAFYGSECGRSDLCCYCASPNAEVNEELKSKYKTVLPLCPSCANKGCRTVCFRPIKK